jgi:cytochrome c peroxidase
MIVNRSGGLSLLAGLSLLLLGPPTAWATDHSDPVESGFARPQHMPVAATDPASTEAQAARIKLGEELFGDPALSGDGSMSCASCHMPALSFTDGIPRRKGRGGPLLARHTPALWNMAWGEIFFWDGRARSLAEQARGPITNPLEMNADLDTVVSRLAARPETAAQFKLAFPDDPRVFAGNLLSALAAYERTLVSPPTRFDQWIAGDGKALTTDEQAGFALFTGKAGCVSCHDGWTLSDQSFHDIGLPSADRGRGAVLQEPALNHAFKTPSLRELNWTAPYMHDGSLATLADVLDHYEKGVLRRPSLSPELTEVILTPEERQQLLAFLATLSSDEPPQPVRLGTSATTPTQPPQGLDTSLISQRDRQFSPSHVTAVAGQALSIINDDSRPHNVRSFDARFAFNGGVQQPGQSVAVTFTEPGTYELICSIHPKMKLTIDVQAER